MTHAREEVTGAVARRQAIRERKRMKDKLVVLVTCANRREAKRIARALVEEKLAACVNIHEARVLSVYRWKGKMEQTREVLLVIKTSQAVFSRLERRVKQLHSYETPEIVGLPIVAGSRAYLDWIDESIARGRLARL
jgi:periplasmic divalent cation tolerance protein